MTKIIENIILPPGGLIVLFLLAGFLLWKNKRIAGFILLGGTVFLLYIMSTGICSFFLLHNLEVSYEGFDERFSIDNRDFKAIVVLGGGVNPFSPETGRAVLSADMEKRIVKGYMLHKQTGLPIIVTGGNLFPDENALSEGEVGKKLLLELGVHEENIIVEDRSLNTAQNAAYIIEDFRRKSSISMDDEGISFGKIILVTSAFHMKRSLYTFNKAGFDSTPMACDFKMPEKFYLTPMSFIPSVGNFGYSVLALREQLGLLFYSLVY